MSRASLLYGMQQTDCLVFTASCNAAFNVFGLVIAAVLSNTAPLWSCSRRAGLMQGQ